MQQRISALALGFCLAWGAVQDVQIVQAVQPLRSVGERSLECDLPVKRVVDGDTFKADTAVWISMSVAFTEESGFRLIGVFTPERKEKRWDKAKQDLIELIGGKKVGIAFVGRAIREKYGRFLVNVYLCEKTGDRRRETGGGTVWVNEEMRKKGWTKFGKGLPK